jgi:hypothetical protein
MSQNTEEVTVTKSSWKAFMAAAFLWASFASVHVIARPVLEECYGTESCEHVAGNCSLDDGDFIVPNGECDDCGCPYSCNFDNGNAAVGWCR